MGVEGITKMAGAIEGIKKAPITNMTVQMGSTVQQGKTVGKTVGTTEQSSSNETGTNSGNKGQTGNDQERLKKAIAYANKNMKMDCEFTYHEKINRVSIKIFNSETKEVIREIPAEEAIEMVEKFYEMAGIIVDEKR